MFLFYEGYVLKGGYFMVDSKVQQLSNRFENVGMLVLSFNFG